MKLKVKRWMKDKKESRERNKKGELEILKTDQLRGRLDLFFVDNEPLAEIANCCEHKLTLGCDLPVLKRTKKQCKYCL
jgi:hypothetical protein